MKTIDATATTSASPDAVWAQLADVSQWSRWGAWSDVHVEGGAEHAPGAIRVLVKRPLTVRERVTDWEPGRKMGYELVDGMNVANYRAAVTLEPTADGGTTVHWHSTYDKAGMFTALILRGAVRDAARRVAKAAATA